MIDEGISFGAWLRARRDKLGMTQDELADKLALSFSMLRKLEAGSRRPSGQIASLLADYFGIPGDEREAFIIFARTGYGAGAAFTTNLAGSEAAPWRATRSRQTNLPATLTTLIGREKDKADLLALVTEPRSRVRLLTLTGAPGIGKTRLALEVASALVEHFDDGVYLVGLAPISDPDLVLPTIAQTLSVQITGGEPVERALQRHLESKHILLVLDNFEQVLDATPALIGLLEGCPWLKVLVTSREALHVRGERRVPLMPLPVPQSRDDYDPASMAENPSVALFVERAQSVRPDFSLTPENSRDVALVCARLEGLPLALEIAAARVALFTPQYILSTLERRLHALEGGPRDLPERQRALRNTIAWSYSLLSVGEQRVFNKLAAFVGGCTLEGAEAVCGEAGVQPLDALLSLARKSLLSVNEGSGEARFVMLEMIGEYAYERLVETGESAQAQQRHAVYYLDLVERAEPELRGRRQLAWLGKLDAEHGNIRTALAWSLKTHSVEIGLRLIGALRWFWTQRSHYMEGLRWGRSVLAMPGAQERNPARARALWSAGALAWLQGDREAGPLLEESVDIWRELGDKSGLGHSLLLLGMTALQRGEPEAGLSMQRESISLFRAAGDKAGLGLALGAAANNMWGLHEAGVRDGSVDAEEIKVLIEESIEIARERGDAWSLALALRNLAWVEMRKGGYSEARPLLEESLSLQRETGTRHEAAATLADLGLLARLDGRLEEAAEIYGRSLDAYRECADRPGIAFSMANLGLVALQMGEAGRAAELLDEALEISKEVESTRHTLITLEAIAWFMSGTGRAEHAATLLAAVQSLYETNFLARPVSVRIGYDIQLEDARAQLDIATWQRAWEMGATMSLGDALRFASASLQNSNNVSVRGRVIS